MARNKSFNPDHKALEKEIIEVFRSCYTDFPRARIKPHESPDFQLIINRHKTIGLEVVRYVLDSQNCNQTNSCIIDADNLNALIEKKEEKSSGYQRMRYTALWLLIVSGSNLSEPVVFHPETFDWTQFSSKVFDRVFYLDMRREQLFRLQ
jgi:hypothetical protein